MTKYSDIEIQTAKNLLGKGFKWIVRYKNGDVAAFSENPNKKGIFWLGTGSVKIVPVSGRFTPLFQSIKWEDNDPVSLESIVHPQILDDAERRYLKAVIRPFREKVTAICKVNDIESDYIVICLEFENVCLPDFPTGTMYKGMKKGHDYTIEELGL